MSYTVLARKYRPQAFEEMTGQEHVVKTVENALKLSLNRCFVEIIRTVGAVDISCER